MTKTNHFLIVDFERHADTLLKEFIGREWLIDLVQGWINDPKASQVLLIEGTYGIGKSAIAARLWRQTGWIDAAHFCIAGQNSTTEPLN